MPVLLSVEIPSLGDVHFCLVDTYGFFLIFVNNNLYSLSTAPVRLCLDTTSVLSCDQCTTVLSCTMSRLSVFSVQLSFLIEKFNFPFDWFPL